MSRQPHLRQPFNTTAPNYRQHGHYLFRVDDTTPPLAGNVTIDGIKIGETLRHEHRYIATGRGYISTLPPPEIPLLPLTIAQWAAKTHDPPKRSLADTNKRFMAQAAATKMNAPSSSYRLPKKPIPAGDRNNQLFVQARVIVHKVGATEEGRAIFNRVNEQCCHPPLPSSEAATIWRSACGYN